MKFRPIVLSISGYDPSGGAGLLADIKTLEQNKVYGLGVATAFTIQNESEFESVEWISKDKILKQIEIVLRKSKVDYVKIGLIENAQTLKSIISYLKDFNPKVSIIWDPVLKASAGFDFHSQENLQKWQDCVSDLFLITPNWEEIKWLSGKSDSQEGAKYLSEKCHVYLKGGHNPEKPGHDYIFPLANTIKPFNLKPRSKEVFQKHGSGCVFASAITAYLSKGLTLNRSSLFAKEYITRFLLSNPTLLGYHKF